MNPSNTSQSLPATSAIAPFDPVRIVVLVGALFWFIFVRSSSGPVESAEVPSGLSRVTLSQKDAAYKPVPRAAGGATGVVWYAQTGPALRFTLRALGLQPSRKYLLELQVDGAIYAVASHQSDSHGEIAIDTTLTRFAEGACVGANYDAPRAVSGDHMVKFWIKRDGNPATGVSPGAKPGAPGADLPCSGNGDGDYAYMLMENEIAPFTGTAAEK